MQAQQIVQAVRVDGADLIVRIRLAVAAFIAVWIGLLVVIRKDSPLNVLTRCWASFIMFFAFEACALLIVLFGGLLGTV